MFCLILFNKTAAVGRYFVIVVYYARTVILGFSNSTQKYLHYNKKNFQVQK